MYRIPNTPITIFGAPWCDKGDYFGVWQDSCQDHFSKLWKNEPHFAPTVLLTHGPLPRRNNSQISDVVRACVSGHLHGMLPRARWTDSGQLRINCALVPGSTKGVSELKPPVVFDIVY